MGLKDPEDHGGKARSPIIWYPFMPLFLFFYLINVNLPLFTFLPLQGGGQEGDGLFLRRICPIPTPALPLKGREFLIAEDQR